MGEFFLELFAEIIGEAFLESSIDLSGQSMFQNG